MIAEIVNDATIKGNLIRASVMTLLYPFTKGQPTGGYGAVRQRSRKADEAFIPNHSPFINRLSQLEQRQTLLEGELVLLKGQLERERVGSSL